MDICIETKKKDDKNWTYVCTFHNDKLADIAIQNLLAACPERLFRKNKT